MGDPTRHKDTRSIFDSRCAQPVAEPRSFHWYAGPDVPRSVRAEVIESLVAPKQTPMAHANLVGDVLGRVRAAMVGNLSDGKVLEPVRLDPQLWEMKWKFKKRLFRLYHAEPTGQPQFVALRFHQKDTSSGDDATIQRLQDLEIELASDRYDNGQSASWGHRKGCSHCQNS